MKVIKTELDVAGIDDADLQAAIQQRVEELREYTEVFSDLVYFMVVEPGDATSSIDEALGFPILWNRFTDHLYGDPAFTPSWDALDDHPGYFELVYVLSSDGAGVVVFVSKADGVDPQLKEMCTTYLAVNAP